MVSEPDTYLRVKLLSMAMQRGLETILENMFQCNVATFKDFRPIEYSILSMVLVLLLILHTISLGIWA